MFGLASFGINFSVNQYPHYLRARGGCGISVWDCPPPPPPPPPPPILAPTSAPPVAVPPSLTSSKPQITVSDIVVTQVNKIGDPMSTPSISSSVSGGEQSPSYSSSDQQGTSSYSMSTSSISSSVSGSEQSLSTNRLTSEKISADQNMSTLADISTSADISTQINGVDFTGSFQSNTFPQTTSITLSSPANNLSPSSTYSYLETADQTFVTYIENTASPKTHEISQTISPDGTSTITQVITSGNSIEKTSSLFDSQSNIVEFSSSSSNTEQLPSGQIIETSERFSSTPSLISSVSSSVISSEDGSNSIITSTASLKNDGISKIDITSSQSSSAADYSTSISLDSNDPSKILITSSVSDVDSKITIAHDSSASGLSQYTVTSSLSGSADTSSITITYDGNSTPPKTVVSSSLAPNKDKIFTSSSSSSLVLIPDTTPPLYFDSSRQSFSLTASQEATIAGSTPSQDSGLSTSSYNDTATPADTISLTVGDGFSSIAFGDSKLTSSSGVTTYSKSSANSQTSITSSQNGQVFQFESSSLVAKQTSSSSRISITDKVFSSQKPQSSGFGRTTADQVSSSQLRIARATSALATYSNKLAISSKILLTTSSDVLKDIAYTSGLLNPPTTSSALSGTQIKDPIGLSSMISGQEKSFSSQTTTPSMTISDQQSATNEDEIATRVAKIVGGTLGGLGLIGFGLAGVYFMRRRSKDSSRDDHKFDLEMGFQGPGPDNFASLSTFSPPRHIIHDLSQSSPTNPYKINNAGRDASSLSSSISQLSRPNALENQGDSLTVRPAKSLREALARVANPQPLEPQSILFSVTRDSLLIGQAKTFRAKLDPKGGTRDESDRESGGVWGDGGSAAHSQFMPARLISMRPVTYASPLKVLGIEGSRSSPFFTCLGRGFNTDPIRSGLGKKLPATSFSIRSSPQEVGRGRGRSLLTADAGQNLQSAFDAVSDREGSDLVITSSNSNPSQTSKTYHDGDLLSVKDGTKERRRPLLSVTTSAAEGYADTSNAMSYNPGSDSSDMLSSTNSYSNSRDKTGSLEVGSMYRLRSEGVSSRGNNFKGQPSSELHTRNYYQKMHDRTQDDINVQTFLQLFKNYKNAGDKDTKFENASLIWKDIKKIFDNYRAGPHLFPDNMITASSGAESGKDISYINALTDIRRDLLATARLEEEHQLQKLKEDTRSLLGRLDNIDPITNGLTELNISRILENDNQRVETFAAREAAHSRFISSSSEGESIVPGMGEASLHRSTISPSQVYISEGSLFYSADGENSQSSGRALSSPRGNQSSPRISALGDAGGGSPRADGENSQSKRRALSSPRVDQSRLGSSEGREAGGSSPRADGENSQSSGRALSSPRGDQSSPRISALGDAGGSFPRSTPSSSPRAATFSSVSAGRLLSRAGGNSASE